MSLKIDQIADAIVAVPGVTVEMLNVGCTADRSTNSTSFVGIGGAPGDIIGQFVAPVAGTYSLGLIFNAYSASATGWGWFRLVFDYDTTPIYVGGGDTWFTAFYSGDVRRYKFTDVVALTAGVHKVQLQWKILSGIYMGMLSCVTQPYSKVLLRGTLVSGSGAGGTILTKDTIVTNPELISSATFADIPEGLSVDISVFAGETVLLCMSGSAQSTGVFVSYLQWVAGASVLDTKTLLASGNNLVTNIDWTTPYTFATAGTYTIKLQAKQSAGNWSLYDGVLSVLQYRGGLIDYLSVDPRSTDSALYSFESKKAFTNEGATGEVAFTLPTAESNLSFTFVVQDTDGLKITAAAGDTIRIGGQGVSGSAGYVRSTTQGGSITLLAINATEWVALSTLGTWTIDS